MNRNSVLSENDFHFGGQHDMAQESIKSSPPLKIEADLHEFECGEIGDSSKKIRIEALARKYSIDHKQLVRKIDLYIVPSFCLLNAMSFLNKSTFGIILVDGINVSLGTTYGAMLAGYISFFFPFTVFQGFSTLILKYVRPHFWISCTVLFYGAVSVGSGYVKTLPQFCACQFLHGFFQSGTEAAIYYILAHYYAPREAQKRFSIIFATNALGGILASSINLACTTTLQMKHGLEGWRWLFVIEGSMTMVAGVIQFFIFPDFPEGARFFSDSEAMFLIQKLEVYTGKSGYNLKCSVRDIVECLVDPLVFLPSLVSFTLWYTAYTLSFFEPLTLIELGYVLEESTKRTCYSWIAVLVWCVLNAFIVDFLKVHLPMFLLNLSLVLGSMVGIVCLFNNSYLNVKMYVCEVLMLMGSYAGLSILTCWTTMNLGGHLRKSVGISLQVSVGTIGGLIVFWSYSGGEAGNRRGFIAGAGLTGASFVFIGVYTALLWRSNKLKRTLAYKENWDTRSKKAKILFGDKSPSFDYMY